MKKLSVYDPAMCCSSGVCGPSVDPTLARFAADLAWAKSQGVEVQRHNLAQEPAAFLAELTVSAALQDPSALPIVMVDAEVVARGAYPDRRALALALGLQPPAERKALQVLGG